jgi:Dolichyl-phosphate-mannose-protein mannosyltransferase
VPRLTVWLAPAGVTVAGLAVRAIPLAVTDFPVNDGGLFLAMTRAVQDAGWALPVTVEWNGSQLPFIYPPLAFYKAGLLEAFFGLDMYGIFRWFPLMWSTLVVPAVFLLGRELLRSEVGGLVAALAYALTPVSFVWLIQGGGVTRAPGMFLAAVMLWQLVILVREPTLRRSVGVGLLAGITTLVHPGAAIFTAISAILIWLFEGRARASARAAGVAIGVAALVVAPWALLVISRHGLGAIVGVPSNGPAPALAILAALAGRVTGTPVIDPLAITGLALAILCVVRRRFLLPLWYAVSLFISFQYAMIPFAILIGLAATDLWNLRAARPSPRLRLAPTVGLALLGLLLVIEGALSATAMFNPRAPLHALSEDRREAMAWVASELESDVRVAVVTINGWSSDPDSEWFPQLAQRQSVATVQGAELLGRAAFEDQFRAHAALQECVIDASVTCLRDWLAEWPSDYLYLPKGHLHGPNSPADCCADLRAGLLADPAFTPVYDGPGATILRVNREASADAGG